MRQVSWPQDWTTGGPAGEGVTALSLSLPNIEIIPFLLLLFCSQTWSGTLGPPASASGDSAASHCT